MSSHSWPPGIAPRGGTPGLTAIGAASTLPRSMRTDPREGRMTKTWLAAAWTIALCAPHDACAQAYPSRPVRIIVPSAPGGLPDIQARLMANELTKQVGQQFV